MKKIIYISTILISISACRSVEKLVEKGDYDGAIELAAKKLAGEDEPKTKHVRGLETGFRRVMEKDVATIKKLQSRGNGENWDHIYSIYEKIDRRQEMISPFLPLVSKDGYVAKFQFLRVRPLLEDAAQNAAEYHYDRARELLKLAEGGNKNKAVEAYYELGQIDRYFDEYRDMAFLKNEAHQMGIKRTLVETRNLSGSILPDYMEEELLNLNIREMNGFWHQYYTHAERNDPMDYKAILEIHGIDVSPEREKEVIYFEEKEIRDGLKYVLDENGNVVKDSLGNDIKEPRYIIVRAEVSELFREKLAFVSGQLKIIDLHSEETISHKPIESEAAFASYASRYSGDKRALSSRSKKYLRTYPEPFPTDYSLLMVATEEIKHSVRDYLRRHSL